MKKVKLSELKIYSLLKKAKKHISFHTPGHKYGKWDITELDFSDNLASPNGVLKEAQQELAHILKADTALILTDGSTCGVFCILQASGAQKIVFGDCSHKSVYNGCALLKIQPIIVKNKKIGNIPQPLTAEQIEQGLQQGAEAVLLTSPDYYGNIADYKKIKEVCKKYNALLLDDGAHGSHLKGTSLYAGNYCDLWVDGVHKNLPAFTQGAIVCAKEKVLGERLKQAADIFRTTSPNYLIMASIEYAEKYPRQENIEKQAQALAKKLGAYPNEDWTKLVLHFGKETYLAESILQKHNIYAEFNDGENLLFYLSWATKTRELKKLEKIITRKDFPPCLSFDSIKEEKQQGLKQEGQIEQVSLNNCLNRICAKQCGLFPPCLPLLEVGETVTKEKLQKLQKAKNTFGLTEGKMTVYKK